jgi:hypothetical protein
MRHATDCKADRMYDSLYLAMIITVPSLLGRRRRQAKDRRRLARDQLP